MLGQFDKIKTSSDELNAVQDEVEATFREFSRKELLDGVLLKDVLFETGSLTGKNVAHGLDREPLGWMVVSKNANANLWQSEPTLPTRFLVLNASAQVTVDLWVF